jgi:hypothetical protein
MSMMSYGRMRRIDGDRGGFAAMTTLFMMAAAIQMQQRIRETQCRSVRGQRQVVILVRKNQTSGPAEWSCA